MTPAYDLLSTQPYLKWQDPMSLPMYGRANRLSRRWWLDAAARLGLAERAMVRPLDRIVAASEHWEGQLVEIGLDDRATERLRQMMASRRAELSE